MGSDDASLGEQILYIQKAESETVMELNLETNDFRRKVVASIGGSHTWIVDIPADGRLT